MLSATLAAFTFAVSPALASEPRVQVADSSPVPTSDTIVSTPITTSFDVVLRQKNADRLSAFLTSLSDTASPNYHHYLSTSQFASEFGAAPSSVATVRSYLATYGLKIGALSKGRVLLHVSGTTTNIAHAFDTPVETVRTSSGLAAQFAAKATLPASIASDVVTVAGLSTVTAPTPASIVSHASAKVITPSTCASAGSSGGSTPNSLGGYTLQQQGQLYGLSAAWASGDNGTGQTIAVYELGQYNSNDVATYFTCYGLSPAITPVPVDGGAAAGNQNGEAEEATLDVEEASALAPGAAIKVYEGPNSNNGPTDVYQAIADDNTASIVTTSWGTCESDPTGDPLAEQAIFEQMTAQGQTIVASAGDNGSSDCSGVVNNALAVDDPASQPYVTGVGGLSVSSISPLSQSVWNSAGAAGGGGVSILWSRPSWQSAPGIATTATMRQVPDLSVMADPNTGFIDYYSGASVNGVPICRKNCGSGWSPIGGTSIGAPLVSALVAVAAQACSVTRLGLINPALYSMATNGIGFNDVTSGNNNLHTVAGYSAGVGYDNASGLGSPNGAAFLAGLCPAKINITKSSFTTSGQNPTVNTSATVTAVLKDANSNPITNTAVSVTAGSTAGTIVLDGSTSSTTGTGAASYEISTDSTGTASFTVSSDAVGPVTLTISYAGQTLNTTTLDFAALKSTAKVPGKTTIKSLKALPHGFRLTVTAPSSNGASPITSYQYSINSGASWITFSALTRSVSVMNLAKSRTYVVRVRALNAKGPGVTSAPARVTTLS